MRNEPVISLGKAFIRSLLLAAALATGVAGFSIEGRAQADRGGMPGDFDYYMLALSWSPAYCDGRGGGEGGDRGQYDGQYGGGGYGGRRGYRGGDSDEQCSGVRPYAFVLHGLWPQYERRGWPEFCQSSDRPWVPEEMVERMTDIMPSRRLVIQEYRKHGICSGLDPRQYFETARKAYRSVRVPDEFQDLSRPLTVSPEAVRKAFLAVNPQLTPDMIQIVCSRNLLRELRICFTKDLTPRGCSQNEQNRRLCTYDTVTMPPVRGGGTGPHGFPSFGRRDSL
jgi:ribonuclease T2